ncbi:MAG: sulfite exporter TauE/SafE family protein [Bacteroidetes bacterium]|nr:sulfite exporter TauE/SafE family protein [Bacteroidota bacterium]
MNLLWTGFLLGITGTIHCVAMCGPLILALPFNQNTSTAWVKRLLYHAGRITSYAIIGMAVGAIGEVASIFIYQQWLSVISGVIILLILALKFLKIKTNFFPPAFLKIPSSLIQQMRGKNTFFFTPIMGMLNGFLPCGLVYIAATASFGEGSGIYSIEYMLAFGAGTLPVMLFLPLISKFLSAKINLSFSKISPYLATIVACLFILRGLALGVPYLSPKISHQEPNKVEGCCEKME